MTVQNGQEADWLRDEHEMWQILRRKPGYIVHHLYQAVHERQHRLVYSEWESKKALDGARQLLQNTPLGRRARAMLTAAPEHLAVELVGPVTSTKGLDLPQSAVAMTAVARLSAPPSGAHERHDQLGKIMASQPGHVTHVLFRGFEDPTVVGAFSHWQDLAALDTAIASFKSSDPAGVLSELAYVQYEPLRT